MKYGLLLTLVCLTITSCGRSPEDSNSAIMDFKIVDVQMEGVSDTSPKFSFPSQNRKYKIAGTAVDSYTLNPIPHASFIIDYGIEGKVTVQSDASGRLFWNELIRFNLLNEKKRILITRGFSAQTSQASASEVSYSIYPYASYISDDVSEFLIHNEVVPDEFVDKLDAAKWNKRKAELHSKNATLQLKYLKPSNQGGVYRFQLNSEVSVILEKSNGEEFDYDLQNSQFDLQLIIYEGRADRDSAVALYSGYFKDVKVLNGKLDQEFEGTISLRNFTSDIYVGIRLIPTVQADQFSEFHGLYNLGKVGEVQGRHELTFERALNSRHSAYKIPQPYSVQKDGVDNSIKNINFSKLDLEYDLIEDGETPTWRSIIYRSSTCAKDLYNGNELAFEKFKIVKTSGEEIIREADGDGCLFWNERIEHKYYKPESFFTRTNTITHISSNISRHVTSYINPWTILTIGRDEREMDKATLARLASREVVHPRLFLAEYFYETIGVTYYIDQFLTLFVRKNIQLVLEFEVTRYSSLTDGINAKEAIRDGVYLLKVALEKSYIDTRKSQVDIDQTMESVEVRKGETRKPLEYIYIVNKLVRVWNGHIITPIELSIHDLRLMTVRSNFLVQLETIEQNHLNLSKNFDIEEIKTDRVVGKIQQAFPGQEPNLDLLVDHDSGLPTRTFAGPMVLLEIEGGAEVRPTDAMNICETDDCNFLERNNPELRKRIYKHDKKYYGNIHH
ncbi:MAG: hypothetical protein KDD61_15930, partial [Bdellovibrionales bacterium]|nr:hypothetical protein [Bdellovibrionales bacterium]